MPDNQIDIKENYILQKDSELLVILLKDNTSKKNIIWATNNYEHKGYGYDYKDNITVQSITGRNGKTIRPRIEKSKKELLKRTKEKAEVFTPSWVCNAQNNLIDDAWFGVGQTFNYEVDKGWITNKDKIAFSDESGKSWQDYVLATRLEITCGEAPYLVSRYDTVTGEKIAIIERIGLLDRKLRIVNENTETEEEWYHWAKIAFQNTYGYEWQGDNIILARENLLLTFEDYYIERFSVPPIREYLIEIATIISWNIWQMDGLKYVIPNSCIKESTYQMSLFEEDNIREECYGCTKNDINKHTGIYCKIKDWKKNKIIKFVTLLGG